MGSIEYYVDTLCENKVEQDRDSTLSVGPKSINLFTLSIPGYTDETAVLHTKGPSGECDTQVSYTKELTHGAASYFSFLPKNYFTVTTPSGTTTYHNASTVGEFQTCMAEHPPNNKKRVDCVAATSSD